MISPFFLCIPNLNEWLHLSSNVVGFAGTEKNGHPHGLISFKSKLYIVFSQRKMKPLKGPVEVIDDTGVPPVHINLNFLTRFLRAYLDPYGSVIGIPITIRPVTTITIPVTTISKTMPVTMPIAMPVAMPVMVLCMDLGRK